MIKKLELTLDYFLEFIFPSKCIVCNNIFNINEIDKIFCTTCLNSLEYINLNSCLKCSRPLISNEKIFCKVCNENINISDSFGIFYYDNIISTTIKNFKFNNHPSYGKGIGSLMSNYFEENILYDIDYFVPVPMHSSKEKKRGFNQAEIICNEMTKSLNKKTSKNLLLRTKNTKPQSSLNKNERKNNVSNAFVLNKKFDVKNKNILIIDDIFTTGSTIKACSKVLKENGANNIYSFCFSIAKNK